MSKVLYEAQVNHKKNKSNVKTKLDNVQSIYNREENKTASNKPLEYYSLSRGISNW